MATLVVSAMTNKKSEISFDPKQFLETVNGGRTFAAYRKGQVIFAQASPADTVHYILKGKIKISVTSEQGKEAVVAILGPSEFFGEGCLIGQLVHLSTASALTDCEVTRVAKKDMVRVLHNEPALSEVFLAHLLTRNERIVSDLVDQLFNSSEKRLARLLLLLANFGKEGAPEPVIAKISQETLAEMIGTTRSRRERSMRAPVRRPR